MVQVTEHCLRLWPSFHTTTINLHNFCRLSTVYDLQFQRPGRQCWKRTWPMRSLCAALCTCMELDILILFGLSLSGFLWFSFHTLVIILLALLLSLWGCCGLSVEMISSFWKFYGENFMCSVILFVCAFLAVFLSSLSCLFSSFSVHSHGYML